MAQHSFLSEAWPWLLAVVIACAVSLIWPHKPASATSTSYLCSIDAYREERIKNEIHEIEQKGGSEFDKDAGRKRIMAVPLSTLETSRQADLAFTRKVYRDAGKGEICPNQ